MTPDVAQADDVTLDQALAAVAARLHNLGAEQLATVARAFVGVEFILASDPAAAAVFAALAVVATHVAGYRQQQRGGAT